MLIQGGAGPSLLSFGHLGLGPPHFSRDCRLVKKCRTGRGGAISGSTMVAKSALVPISGDRAHPHGLIPWKSVMG